METVLGVATGDRGKEEAFLLAQHPWSQEGSPLGTAYI